MTWGRGMGKAEWGTAFLRRLGALREWTSGNGEHGKPATFMSFPIPHLRSLIPLLLLAACSTTPSPDWKVDADSLLEAYGHALFEGNSRLADLDFRKARAEIARTGRLDLAAFAELTRCAYLSAVLEFGACEGYDRLAAQATPAEQAYARFLTGQWTGLDARQLPPQYADLVKAKDDAARAKALGELKDPVSRAIAAGVLLRAAQASPEVIALATRTASDQGWRRPLLAWLQVGMKRAQAAGDQSAQELLRRRIELVESSVPAKP
jgi:hypothetical protein